MEVWFLGGSDFIYGPNKVTIPAGQTSMSFNISIVDDTMQEGNESFDLFIVPRSLPNRVTQGNPSSITINILDDDGKSLIKFTYSIKSRQCLLHLVHLGSMNIYMICNFIANMFTLKNAHHEIHK